LPNRQIKKSTNFLTAKAYVPPHLRGANKSATAAFKSKLHDDDEKADTKLKISSNEKKTLDPQAEKEKKIKNLKKV